MGNSCKICNLNYNTRLEIDRELVQGKSISTIARKHHVSRDSLTYHKTHHLSGALAKAWSHKMDSDNMSILDDLNNLIDRTKSILDKAEEKEQLGTQLQAIREIRESYKLLSQIAFSLAQAKQDELIIAQMERKEVDDEEAKQRLDSMREKLTDREFDLFLFLTLKINDDPSFKNKLVDIDRHLPHDSDIWPALTIADLGRDMHRLCERSEYEWAKQNNVTYEGMYKQKKLRDKQKASYNKETC